MMSFRILSVVIALGFTTYESHAQSAPTVHCIDLYASDKKVEPDLKLLRSDLISKGVLVKGGPKDCEANVFITLDVIPTRQFTNADGFLIYGAVNYGAAFPAVVMAVDAKKTIAISTLAGIISQGSKVDFQGVIRERK
jgi:hypothetical protein